MSNAQKETAESEGIAKDISKGVIRHLIHRGYSPLTELTLNTGRRVDVAALNKKGEILFVEIKSGLPDFRADNKWQEYLPYCDRFYFAVNQNFPVEVLPEEVGLILADKFDAAIMRDCEIDAAHSSRRKAVLLRFARTAAHRLYAEEDPKE